MLIKKGDFFMKKRKSKYDFNFENQNVKVNKKDVYLCSSNMFDSVSKKDLNRMQRRQKINRKM